MGRVFGLQVTVAFTSIVHDFGYTSHPAFGGSRTLTMCWARGKSSEEKKTVLARRMSSLSILISSRGTESRFDDVLGPRHIFVEEEQKKNLG